MSNDSRKKGSAWKLLYNLWDFSYFDSKIQFQSIQNSPQNSNNGPSFITALIISMDAGDSKLSKSVGIWDEEDLRNGFIVHGNS